MVERGKFHGVYMALSFIYTFFSIAKRPLIYPNESLSLSWATEMAYYRHSIIEVELSVVHLYISNLSSGAYIVLMPVEVQITLIPNNDTRRSAEALKSSGLPVNLTAALVSY